MSVDVSALEAAVDDQSFRTLDEQAKVLDGIRSRAGGLVAVASVATAFVGGPSVCLVTELVIWRWILAT